MVRAFKPPPLLLVVRTSNGRGGGSVLLRLPLSKAIGKLKIIIEYEYRQD